MKRFLVLLAGGLPAALVGTVVWLWTGSVLAAVLLVVVPIMAFAQVKPMHDELPPREVIYRSSIGSHLILGGLALWVGLREFGAGALGLVPAPGWVELGWAVVLVGVLLAATVASQWLSKLLGLEESDLIRQLIPLTGGQRATFALMSVTAGLAEEMIYRGFLFLVLLQTGMSVAGALVVSSLAFGMVHAYQGTVGIARTAVLGVAFGASVVLLQSLWPAIIAHILFDWLVGLLLADYFLGEPPAEDAPTPITPPSTHPPPSHPIE